MGIKYKINRNFFKSWSSKTAYAVGFIAADGSLENASYLRGKYLRICSCDKDILERMKLAMNSEHKIISIKAKELFSSGKNMYVKKNICFE